MGVNKTLALSISIIFLVAACAGGGDQTAPDTTPQDAEPTTPAATSPTEAAGACETIDLADAPPEPVTIRLGHGFAAEEQVWLMAAQPDLTQHQGTWYELEMTAFRGNEERFVAYQAGELDAGTATSVTLARAVPRGIDVGAVVTVTTESDEASFRTTFSALEESGIADIEDLEGKKIGIVDIGSATEYWARTAVAKAGLDHNVDAEYVVLPFPAQEETLRSGQIDVAVLVEPFYTIAHQNGGLVDVFDALTGPGFDQELILVWFDNAFLEENPGVVCAWIEDFQAVTDWYNDNLDEARDILVEAEFVRTPPEVFKASGDWLHPQDGVISLEAIDRVIDSMIEFGVMQEDERIPAEDIVAVEFAPLSDG